MLFPELPVYPHPVHVLGVDVSIWNATFLLAIVLGYPVLRVAMRRRRTARLPAGLPLLWAATVYGSALGAQLFAYAFDLNTSLLPPGSVGWARYYLDPMFGAKTLYGAIVLLPVTVGVVAAASRDLTYREALDAWTPALFVVLAVARVGCFLQGCCYGVPSRALGMAFPPDSSVYFAQVRAGLIVPGSWTLPVVPTQVISALVLFVIAGATLRALRVGRRDVFPASIAAYSVFRLLIESLRSDPDRNFLGPLSTSQWIALAILLGYVTWKNSPRLRAAFAFQR